VTAAGAAAPTRLERAGLPAGPLLFLLVLLLPAPAAMSEPAHRVAALTAWMATWWLATPVPLQATALLPLVMLPVLGVASFDQAAAPYANNVIFLFLGGFFVAAAMERWGLHKRVAFGILAVVGTDARRVVLAFMLATGFISMWISNTATAVMMMPMAMAVLVLARQSREDAAGKAGMGAALVLGIAYAASIGGMATLIGTPPNAIFAASAKQLLQVDVGFGEWMTIGLPIVAVLLPASWLLLTTVFPTRGPIPGLAERLVTERTALGPLRGGERFTLAVFLLAVTGWILRDPKTIGTFTIPGIATYAPAITDSGIAIVAALLLFVVPFDWRARAFALDWQTARTSPWGMLLLFGGGLSLADAFLESGLSGWLGSVLGGMAGLPTVVVILGVAAVFMFFTELASNAAVTAMAMPLLFGIAPALGQEPRLLMTVAALSASCAFMLPVSTPPNTVAFSTGEVTVREMFRAGLLLNLTAIVVITAAAMILM
jgi:sodium-dependent dicarboxylate transporter 2/3/5